ncbi:hypothetical protein S40285_09252 [Stachybotrys chlorohalonatus IBT 40285]|uniref:Uncharacterized protein n=1 Tax=Stachybotrys chlorohalonatus (strain IBT 40285) TaxID=1283841 RepID=A0A084QXD7_STAC4|nr:hypothetical protein S40285_09252 [Stachybotrys chlorohalonata IBT 40285]
MYNRSIISRISTLTKVD